MRMVKDPTQVIPCGCVIRCKRDLSLNKASDGRARVQGHRHMGAGQISAPLYAERLKEYNVRQLTPHRLVCIPACAYLASILE